MSRMLEALRRIESRTPADQEPSVLVRPRRVEPSPAAQAPAAPELSCTGGPPGAETVTSGRLARIRLDAQFHESAARVLARLPAGQPAVVGFCVLGPEPASVVAPLAVALVQQVPGEVVLVEADPHPCSLAERLGTFAGHRHRIPLEVLRTGRGWSQLAQGTSVPRLSVVASTRALDADQLAAGPRRWEAAIDEFRQQHQLVLVVTGPPADATTLRVLAACDGVFVLATLGHTGTRQTCRAIESIRHVGGTVCGVLLTDPK